MKELNFPCVTEQSLVCRSLVHAAENASVGMDKFVLWMLTAFGAGLTYLLGKDLSRVDNFKVTGFIYLAAVLVTILQRYLAMLVETGAKGFRQGEEINKQGLPVDLARYLVVFINSVPTLQQPLMAWLAVQMMNGDLMAIGRALYRVVLCQVILGTISCALLIWTAKEALQRV